MQKQNLPKDEILKLAKRIDEGEEDKDQSISISGVYIGGEIGFPLRIFSEESESNPGEPKNYSNAYDKACSALGTDQCYSYAEYGFVWFGEDER